MPMKEQFPTPEKRPAKGRLARALTLAGVIGAGAGALGQIETRPASARGPDESAEQAPKAGEEAAPAAAETANEDKYRSQGILAQRFVEAVSQKLREAKVEGAATAEQNLDDETFRNDPEEGIRQAMAKEKELTYPGFARMAALYPSASPEQQAKMRAQYAQWRHTLQFEANYNTSEMESDLDKGDDAAKEKHERDAAGAQQAVDALDAAIGPEALAAALKYEDEVAAPDRAKKYTGDPFSPNYVPSPGSKTEPSDPDDPFSAPAPKAGN